MSTVHVYGHALSAGAEISEETAPRPRDAYAISRLASEHLLAAGAGPGVETVVLRFTNVVGAPAHASVDRWSLVANDLCRQGTGTGVLRLQSDGLQWRDFLSMEDACRILMSAAGVPIAGAGRMPAGTYNVASGHPLTIRALAELVQSSVERHRGARPPLEAPPPAGAPTEPWRVSTARLDRLGIRPMAGILRALDETVAFCTALEDATNESRGARWARSKA